MDQSVADSMMSRALQAYANEDSDAMAWDALFAHLDGEPGEWRTRAQHTDPCVLYFWSTSAADGKTQDCLLTAYDEATYVINFSVPKSHNAAACHDDVRYANAWAG